MTLALEDWRGLSAIAAGIVLTRRDDRLDRRVVDPGARLGALADPPLRPGRVRGRPSSGWRGFMLVLREDVPWLVAVPTFAVAGFGMGLAYAPAGAHRAARGVGRDPGHRVERPVADGHARDGDRDRACRRDRRGRRCGRRGSRSRGLAVAFAVSIAVGVGGLVLTRRLARGPTRANRAALPAEAVPPT